MNIYEVLRVKKKLVARNISTGVIAADGVIRAIQLRNAEKDNQNLILDPASGRITRIAKTGEQLKGKASFSEITANRDPEIMFSNLRNLTKMVAKGLQPSLVVTGMAGMGKTHVVKQTLEEAGLKESTDFVHFKGRATAAGLYITLYENSDKIIVLDDCDSVFKDDDAINILKGALDSYDTRMISYITSRELKDSYLNPVPRSFEFTGKVIFISNISQSKLDDAIKSRSFVQEISMTIDQVFLRMEQLLMKIEPKIKREHKESALLIMKNLHTKYDGVEVNIRSLIKASRIVAMGFENPEDLIGTQIITLY
jgi:hypothetical protein